MNVDLKPLNHPGSGISSRTFGIPAKCLIAMSSVADFDELDPELARTQI